MGFQLVVPMIKQQNENSCWFASANMLNFYKQIPPIDVSSAHTDQFLKDVYRKNTGLSVDDLPEFCEIAGFDHLENFSKYWEAQDFTKWLRTHGPLYCHGDFGLGGGHVVVAIGVDDFGNVLYNDPAPSAGPGPSTMPATTFAKMVNRPDYQGSGFYPVLWRPLSKKPLPIIPK